MYIKTIEGFVRKWIFHQKEIWFIMRMILWGPNITTISWWSAPKMIYFVISSKWFKIYFSSIIPSSTSWEWFHKHFSYISSSIKSTIWFVSWLWNEEVHSNLSEEMLSKHIGVLYKLWKTCNLLPSHSCLE